MRRRKYAAAAAMFTAPVPPPPTGRELQFGARSPRFSDLRDGAARAKLRELVRMGADVVVSARSPHGSDCDCRPEHLHGPMGHCRCVRVVRLRVAGSGDWLLLWGDITESQAFKLQGPYTHDADLSYGGGFWCKVTV